MKKFLKHALAVALVTVFVLLAFGSDGGASTPSSGGGGGYSVLYTYIFKNNSSAVIKVTADGNNFTLSPGGSRSITSYNASINIDFDAEGPKAVRAEHLNRAIHFYDN